MRLDDASEYMDLSKWARMEKLLDKYSIKPIYGIIPHNRDSQLVTYGKVENFWELMKRWEKKGWIPALHGYEHVFETDQGGINPVNNKSEFAGVSLEKQCDKIRKGYGILLSHGIEPSVFFAPAHTFDHNTLEALVKESEIRIISDTVAADIYFEEPFYFVPQQSGRARVLPLKVVTFCYHPNIMSDQEFEKLEKFLARNGVRFGVFNKTMLKKRKKGIKDEILSKIYFARKIR